MIEVYQQTIEAEITISNKQRQIDVLEAQLQEAEDIITDLRSELRWVRDKLVKAKVFNDSQAWNVVNKEEETFSAQNADKEFVVGSLDPNQKVADTCFSVTVDALPNQRLLLEDECGNDEKRFDGLSVSTLKGCDACESELDVSISNKKLELSRNGCTQRIHALERNVLERKLSPSANDEEQCITEKDGEDSLSSGKVNGLETSIWGNTRCLVLALRSRNAEVITKPTNALGIKRGSKSCKSRGKRKRRWGKRKATSVRSQSQLIKPCKSQSDLPCSKTAMDNSDGDDSMETHRSVESEEVDALNACKGLEDHLQHKRTLYTDNIGNIRDVKRSKNMANLGGIASTVHPSDHLVESCEESNVVSINVEDDEKKAHIPENETEIKPLPPLDPGLTSFTTNVDPTSGSTNDTVVSANAANLSTDEDLQLRKEDVLVKCEGEEHSVVPSTKMGSELVNLHSDSKVTAVVSDQISESPRADANRLVMYTFQRKRKKGSLNINNDNTSSPGKREVKETENSAQDPIESTVSNEPSRETPVIS